MKAGCHKRRSPNQKCNQKCKGSKELAKFASRWGGGEGGEGYSPIKVTGVLVVPLRGLNLWIGTN